jgi:hypothetical protein
MNTTCKKCGAPASGEQAFCAKCGAVLGMEGAPKKPDPPNLARTIVGQNFKLPPLPKKPTAQVAGAQTKGPAGAPRLKPQATKESSEREHSSVLLVLVGFLAVLLVGGILLILLYFLLLS